MRRTPRLPYRVNTGPGGYVSGVSEHASDAGAIREAKRAASAADRDKIPGQMEVFRDGAWQAVRGEEG
jgi:hypothetical protein